MFTSNTCDIEGGFIEKICRLTMKELGGVEEVSLILRGGGHLEDERERAASHGRDIITSPSTLLVHLYNVWVNIYIINCTCYAKCMFG